MKVNLKTLLFPSLRTVPNARLGMGLNRTVPSNFIDDILARTRLSRDSPGTVLQQSQDHDETKMGQSQDYFTD